MTVNLYGTRIVEPDDETIRQLVELKHSRDWGDELDELERLQAFTYAQIPRKYWGLSTKLIQDRKVVGKLNKYILKIEKFVGEQHLGLLFHGDPGVGKTFLAAHVSMRAIEAGLSVFFYDYQDFRTDVLTNAKDEKRQARIKALVDQADVLVLNDFNFVKTTPKERTVLQSRMYGICRQRQDVGAMIVVHRGPGKQGPLDEDTMAVLKEFVYPMNIKGTDLRDGQAQQKFDSVLG